MAGNAAPDAQLLELHVGDIVEVVARGEGNWLSGRRRGGGSGWFPRQNVVDHCPEPEPEPEPESETEPELEPAEASEGPPMRARVGASPLPWDAPPEEGVPPDDEALELEEASDLEDESAPPGDDALVRHGLECL